MPPTLKTVQITPKESAGMAEEYWEWFTCPNCTETDINRSYSFCPHCGVKLEHVYDLPGGDRPTMDNRKRAIPE